MEASQVGLVATSNEPAASDRTSGRSRIRLASRVTQIGLGVLAVAMAVVGAVLFDTDAAIFTFGWWPVAELLPVVVALAIAGAFLLGYRAARVVAWTLLACAVATGASVLTSGLWWESLAQGWPVTAELAAANQALMILGLSVVLVVLPQVYPDGPLAGWLFRGLLALTLLITLARVGLTIVTEWGLSQVYADLSGELVEFIPAEQAWEIGGVLGDAAVVITVVAVLERLRRGPRERRRQILGFAVLYLITIVVLYVNWFTVRELRVDQLGQLVWPLAATVAIAVGVARHGLFGVRPLVRRAAAFTVLAVASTAVLAALYLLLLSGLSEQVVGPEYRWLAVVAAMVVLLVADPLRRRLRVVAERRLLGARSEPLSVLGRLDTLASSGGDIEGVLSSVADAVAEAVPVARGERGALPRGARRPRRGRRIGAAGPLVLPLLHRGERLGELRVAPRTPGEHYGKADRTLLDQIASQVAALAYGMRRDSDIATLREQALGTMTEQRTQLGRDLHDGLAPLLAAAGLTADSLRRGMAPGSADAEEAGRSATRLRNAASEVRRIAHDLAPNDPCDGRLATTLADYVETFAGSDAPAVQLDLESGSRSSHRPSSSVCSGSRSRLSPTCSAMPRRPTAGCRSGETARTSS